MKKCLKKFIALALMGASIVTCATGCSSDTADSVNNGGNEKTVIEY